jgi:predicted dehydrogenase
MSEAVHIFDFCAYMTGSEPVRIFAEGGALTHPEIAGTQDNAVMIVKFAEGSIASITHGDLGSAGYPKERVEFFFGERTVVIDNYQHLEASGFGREQAASLPEVDKGMRQELEELAKAIRSSSRAPVTEVDGARATLCAVRALDAINTGQAQEVDLASLIGRLL